MIASARRAAVGESLDASELLPGWTPVLGAILK